ncbi:DUF5412 family protein [Paenibacillus urinalis]|uniref:DUF5412 family protein n=1 Tax=Paenibacillus urinalis TaxID=521520 RepID=A0AAX3N272_9BACL|nr:MULTISPECIES: DUF5412 family protein [Paenibacillus]WDH83958.1 DUF5412 family protein [Paenibacillus urinalis]WDH95413.1 DUF5412 family protein [Paenibacillus urinalis]WDI03610.1 DUF5412 family protein [Paenibacillus urinalis]GAK40917.1 hypothetical protein TCA2_3408 [Paenibacillus sp. TCA20]
MNETDDWLSNEEVQSCKRRISARTLIIAFLFSVLILGTAIYFLLDLGSDVASGMCGNLEIRREGQPDDGAYDIVLFKRDCGATTDYSYQLSVIKKNSTLENTTANIFISDHEFSASWANKNTIEISGISNEVHKKERNYKGINIHYN